MLITVSLTLIETTALGGHCVNIYVPFIISIISGYILFTAARYILITLTFRNV